jgi:hypothetical protein
MKNFLWETFICVLPFLTINAVDQLGYELLELHEKFPLRDKAIVSREAPTSKIPFECIFLNFADNQIVFLVTLSLGFNDRNYKSISDIRIRQVILFCTNWFGTYFAFGITRRELRLTQTVFSVEKRQISREVGAVTMRIGIVDAGTLFCNTSNQKIIKNRFWIWTFTEE